MADSSNKKIDLLEQIAEAGGLNRGVARAVAQETGVAEAHVFGTGSFYHLLSDPAVELLVCQGLACEMAGSRELLAKEQAKGVRAVPCSCLAECDRAPAMLKRADRLVGGSAGVVGPKRDQLSAPAELAMDLEGAIDNSGAALDWLRENGADRAISELDASGLQGRGGAGFPAVIKWKSVRAQTEPTKYVVLNADEGEPGTFKDREVLFRRPDLVIEGLAIAARVVGAGEIYLYIRDAFEALRPRVEKVIRDLRASGHLEGLEFHYHRGHGAYICGEETALIESLEGKRGMPRHKPPFPTVHGLWQKPTLMHNVETIACVPALLRRGGSWFRELGRTGPGTKLYCVSGHVTRPGVYELPLGVSLDEIVDHAGGYLGELHAFTPGGAASGFLPAKERGRPLDFKGLSEVGSMLGSAGIIVLNRDADLIAAVRNQLVFFEDESCGQCAPCRIGTRFVREAFDRWIAGDATALDPIREVAWEMEAGSICGLGQTAALPLTSALQHFPEAFECPPNAG